ncbi:L-aminoadipate-semialdehyde dehydrogenase-phosphopantetheinyl transferase [Acrasis kona]|uniref:holo-[acyl-carrier-protein] synthase n=1 Tax=Acrasis kona TaxID=1008807 RepID=A0AAW2ZCW9_9EUKA
MLWLGFIRVSEWNVDDVEYLDLLSIVDPIEEKQRIQKYKFRIDSKRSLAGHLIIRQKIKSEYGGNFKLCRTKENKPFCKFKQPIEGVCDFNISHAGDVVIVALLKSSLSSPKVVGVDIEHLILRGNTSLGEFLNDMLPSFDPEEQKCILQPYRDAHPKALVTQLTLTASDEVVQNVKIRFFIHWTLKESFIKAIGKGVYFPLEQAVFKFDSNEENILNCRPQLYVENKHMLNWEFKSCLLDNEHIISVAVGPANDENVSESLINCLCGSIAESPNSH